jgi:hypothetical protein
MADPLDDVKAGINAIVGATEEAKKALLDMVPSTTALARHFGDAAAAAANFGDYVKGGIGKAKALADSFSSGDIVKYFNNSENALAKFIKTASGGTNDLGAFALKTGLLFEPMFGVLPNATDVFGKFGVQAAGAGEDIASSFKTISPILESFYVPEDFLKFLETVGRSSDKVRSLELSLLGTAAASGNLNAFLGETGNDLANMSIQTASFANASYQVAQATGNSIESVSEYMAQLNLIPGALTDIIEVDGTAKNAAETSLKVAAASGISQVDMLRRTQNAYRELGLEIEGSVGMIARMASASQDLKIPMDMVQSYTDESAKKFRMLGINADGAINILDKMATSLKGSGLAPEAIKELATSMVDGIAKMSEGTKAFVSGATGGPGGLAGGFEIDLLIKQGQLDKVSEMVTESMQKQFGKVVTLEDANKNPSQAAELLRQVEFLKQVAGVAKDNQEAYRILEAMQKGEQFDVGPSVKTPEEALRTSVELGNNIQKSQLNVLTVIQNEMERLVQIQALNNRELLQKYIGAKEGSSMSGILAEFTRKSSQEAAASGAGVVSGGQRRTLDELTSSGAKSLGDALKMGMDGAKSLVARVQEDANEKKVDLAKQKAERDALHPTAPLANPASVLRPVEAKAETKKAEGVDVDRKQLMNGNIHILVDIKDGIKTIASEVVTAKLNELYSSAQTGAS